MADAPNDHGHEHEGSDLHGNEHTNPDLSDIADSSENDELISGRLASVRFNHAPDKAKNINKLRMDTANQSLADALRITYMFLQASMVILLILFALSGFKKINEGERGISVFLGKPAKTNLEPGAHPTWPYPIGEMIRVGGGAVEVPLARIFMPNRPGAISDDALLDARITEFNSQGQLNPQRDGSLITADLNIAHTQWTINYHRANHLRFVQNILPEQEQAVVILAARRGIVRTMAETTIDDLLKNSAESIASRVREIAQATLDDFESGIELDRVVLVRKTPPLYLLDRFASVQSAAQNAGKLREDALLKRDQSLNEIAGRGAPVLISMIDDYERLIELGQTQEAEELLAKIDIALAGGDVDYNGQSTLALVSGEVSEILNQAQSLASSRVSQAIADLEQFKAKQAQFEANPTLMIARDWSMAMGEFLNQDFVSTIYLPEGVNAELVINADPDIQREMDRLRKRREATQARDLRYQDFRKDVYKSQRGIQAEDME